MQRMSRLLILAQVSTWGMFPRPRDISKAFGGGRILRPGQELEGEDQRAERANRVAQVALLAHSLPASSAVLHQLPPTIT